MGDILVIAAVLAGFALATALVALVARRRFGPRRAGVILPCGVAVSVSSLVGNYLIYLVEPASPGDGPAMALAGSTIYAMIALPGDLVVAWLILRRR